MYSLGENLFDLVLFYLFYVQEEVRIMLLLDLTLVESVSWSTTQQRTPLTGFTSRLLGKAAAEGNLFILQFVNLRNHKYILQIIVCDSRGFYSFMVRESLSIQVLGSFLFHFLTLFFCFNF